MAWTAEQDAELLFCAAEGVSFAVAAERLGKTRNAVAGRAHRLRVPFACTPELHRQRTGVAAARAWGRMTEAERELRGNLISAGLLAARATRLSPNPQTKVA